LKICYQCYRGKQVALKILATLVSALTTCIYKTVFSEEDEERESSQLMWMDEFDLNQPYNSILSVSCLASGYFSAATMQYALQFENPSELEYIRGEPLTLERLFKSWRNEISARELKASLRLNETRLSRIICFAASENTYNWVNVSRPIQVQGTFRIA
jgi:hypothetical protein